MKRHRALWGLLILCVVVAGCGRETAKPPGGPPATTSVPTGSVAPHAIERIEATPEAVKQAEEELQVLADRDRRMHAALSFEDFKGTVYREPFEGGKFIVNGDTPIANEKQLLEFYENFVKPAQGVRPRLIINQISGMDDKWNVAQKMRLTYCVSDGFGQRHAAVVQEMANATAAWEQVAAIHFIHDASQDQNCTPSNAAVVFDVRPTNVNGEYLARAFFPNEPRSTRNILIDESSFELEPGNLQLVGILRHELGHTLGFRHEHTRPESGTCFEDPDWRPLTTYDALSVMHYPQCNGQGDWSLKLTSKDKNGVACVYGPNAPFTIDPALIPDTSKCAVVQVSSPSGQPRVETIDRQSVARGSQKAYGPFAVAAGTTVDVTIGGAGAGGDPDLYVRFAGPPRTNAYDCRPYLDGPVESCSLTVPANATKVHVMVRGYEAGAYDLTVSRIPPATSLAGNGAQTGQ